MKFTGSRKYTLSDALQFAINNNATYVAEMVGAASVSAATPDTPAPAHDGSGSKGLSAAAIGGIAAGGAVLLIIVGVVAFRATRPKRSTYGTREDLEEHLNMEDR